MYVCMCVYVYIFPVSANESFALGKKIFKLSKALRTDNCKIFLKWFLSHSWNKMPLWELLLHFNVNKLHIYRNCIYNAFSPCHKTFPTSQSYELKFDTSLAMIV